MNVELLTRVLSRTEDTLPRSGAADPMITIERNQFTKVVEWFLISDRMPWTGISSLRFLTCCAEIPARMMGKNDDRLERRCIYGGCMACC